MVLFFYHPLPSSTERQRPEQVFSYTKDTRSQLNLPQIPTKFSHTLRARSGLFAPGGKEVLNKVNEGFLFKILEFPRVEEHAVAGVAVFVPDVPLMGIGKRGHGTVAVGTVDAFHPVELPAHLGIADIDLFGSLNFFQGLFFQGVEPDPLAPGAPVTSMFLN